MADHIRDAFERWARPQGLRLYRRDMAGSERLGQYCNDGTQLAFEAFRAALSHAAGQEATTNSAEIGRKSVGVEAVAKFKAYCEQQSATMDLLATLEACRDEGACVEIDPQRLIDLFSIIEYPTYDPDEHDAAGSEVQCPHCLDMIPLGGLAVSPLPSASYCLDLSRGLDNIVDLFDNDLSFGQTETLNSTSELLVRIANIAPAQPPASAEVWRDAARYRWLRDSSSCSLSINHNDHHCMYQTVAHTLEEQQGYYSDVSDEEKARMVELDSIWTIHEYPSTPVGFNIWHAATLDAAIDAAMAAYSGRK